MYMLYVHWAYTKAIHLSSFGIRNVQCYTLPRIHTAVQARCVALRFVRTVRTYRCVHCVMSTQTSIPYYVLAHDARQWPRWWRIFIFCLILYSSRTCMNLPGTTITLGCVCQTQSNHSFIFSLQPARDTNGCLNGDDKV